METIKSEKVLQTKYLSIEKQQVLLPSGRVVDDYYVAKKANFAMVIALTDDGKVPLLREWKQGIEAYALNLPAGGIGKDESPRQAIERELLEETGYTAEEFQLIGNHYHVSSSWLKDRAYLFYATHAKKVAEPRREDTEDIEVNLVPFEEIVGMVKSGRITDPYTALAVLWVAQEKLEDAG